MRYAGGIGEGAGIAFLDGTGARASIARLGIAVVALLAALERAVAALDDGACAQLPRNANTTRALGFAVGGTTVSVLLVAVIARFAIGRLDDAVTATRSGFAWRAGRWTSEAAFQLTTATAAVAGLRVAVVAILAGFNALVATLGSADAGLSSCALKGRILYRAGGIATIVVEGIAVVAHFTGTDETVAADDLARAFASLGTCPVGLDFADAVATIAGQYVAVIALLDAALIVDAVAAALWHLDDAARGVGAVADTGRSSGSPGPTHWGRDDDETARSVWAATAASGSSSFRARNAATCIFDGT